MNFAVINSFFLFAGVKLRSFYEYSVSLGFQELQHCALSTLCMTWNGPLQKMHTSKYPSYGPLIKYWSCIQELQDKWLELRLMGINIYYRILIDWSSPKITHITQIYHSFSNWKPSFNYISSLEIQSCTAVCPLIVCVLSNLLVKFILQQRALVGW